MNHNRRPTSGWSFGSCCTEGFPKHHIGSIPLCFAWMICSIITAEEEKLVPSDNSSFAMCGFIFFSWCGSVPRYVFWDMLGRCSLFRVSRAFVAASLFGCCSVFSGMQLSPNLGCFALGDTSAFALCMPSSFIPPSFSLTCWVISWFLFSESSWIWCSFSWWTSSLPVETPYICSFLVCYLKNLSVFIVCCPAQTISFRLVCFLDWPLHNS